MIEQIQPGKYRTRDGRLAIVSSPAGTSLNYWVGRVDNDVQVWSKHGRVCCSSGQESPWDLVARIPDETPVDDRVARALHVLRNACDESDDSFDGWDLVRQGIKILEGRE
jgi:hypothetical protein